jgi:hypothetical protein
MKLTFRRRTIVDVGPSGTVYQWKIPLDPEATDDEDALVRHIRSLDRFDHITITNLMGTRIGGFILGNRRTFGGPKSMRGSLGKWEDRKEAVPGRRLTEEEFERNWYSDQPLMLRVYRRLRDEAQATESE